MAGFVEIRAVLDGERGVRLLPIGAGFFVRPPEHALRPSGAQAVDARLLSTLRVTNGSGFAPFMISHNMSTQALPMISG